MKRRARRILWALALSGAGAVCIALDRSRSGRAYALPRPEPAVRDEPDLVAERWYRDGERHRAAGRAVDAQRAFQRVLDCGRTPFHARAELELGHLARRSEAFAEALAHYESVALDRFSAPRHADVARFWCARVLSALGRDEDARRWFERVASAADSLSLRIRAFDRLALSWIAQGDLEAAAGVLEQCRIRFHERALECTETGARVRSALERMTSRRRLREAIEARYNARVDRRCTR